MGSVSFWRASFSAQSWNACKRPIVWQVASKPCAQPTYIKSIYENILSPSRSSDDDVRLSTFRLLQPQGSTAPGGIDKFGVSECVSGLSSTYNIDVNPYGIPFRPFQQANDHPAAPASARRCPSPGANCRPELWRILSAHMFPPTIQELLYSQQTIQVGAWVKRK